jgi:hypothetical protein
MNKAIKIFFLLLAGFSINSCKKEIIHVDPDFVGYWAWPYDNSTCNMAIVIGQGSNFRYYSPTEMSDCKRYPDVSGTAKADKKNIRVGVHTFSITQLPSRMDTLVVTYSDGCCSQFGKAVWQMKIDNKLYYKIIGK